MHERRQPQRGRRIVLDAVASEIDFKQTFKIIERIFGGDIPWAYGSNDDPRTDKRNAWKNLVLGEETWVSDSYPVYHFPKPVRKERKPEDLD
jgi:hypothetical protein